MKGIAKHLATYKRTSAEISRLEKEKDEAKAAIMAAMKEQGLESLEADGYRASISNRTFFGFDDNGPSGEPLDAARTAARLARLRQAFARHLPNQDVPASTNIAKLVDVMMAEAGAIDFETWAGRPDFIKANHTPILRVSGGGS